jgi:hypothetical protein
MKNYKLCVVVPAGRKRYLELLIPHIIRQKEIIDELRLWVNTDVEEDILHIHHLKEKYPNIITLEFHHPNVIHYNKSIFSIHPFWKNTTDENTVYIRLDDDIVWMEENYLKNLYEFRIKNPSYFLVSGNVVNNAICDHFHQNMGVYPPTPKFNFYCMDENG